MEIIELLKEGESIQERLSTGERSKGITKISVKFKEMMQKVNVNGVLKILTNEISNGLLPLTEETLFQLEIKHPDNRDAPEDVLLSGLINEIHPIRRIAEKVVMNMFKKDVMNDAGSLQVCAGQEAGAEAAIHAMYDIYNDEHSEAVLLVDAENAFNSINRNIMLHIISVVCPTKFNLCTKLLSVSCPPICNRWERDIIKRRDYSRNIRTGG